MTQPSIPLLATWTQLRFPRETIFLEIKRASSNITRRRWRCTSPGLLNMSPLSVDEPHSSSKT
jgi:hypothetical protein